MACGLERPHLTLTTTFVSSATRNSKVEKLLRMVRTFATHGRDEFMMQQILIYKAPCFHGSLVEAPNFRFWRDWRQEARYRSK